MGDSASKMLIFFSIMEENGSLSRIRTYGQVINSHLLYR